MAPVLASHRQADDATRNTWRFASGVRLNALAERFRSSGRIISLLFWPVTFLLEAISLGIMHPADVDAIVQSTYASKPEFYDPRRYQLAHEQRLLPRLQTYRRDGHLLDAFCGQGREAELFVRNGFEVTAIDQLDWMIEAGRRYATDNGLSINFQQQDFLAFDSPEPFDVVYTSCWMYSTTQGTRNRARFLQQCKYLCRPDGVAVISYVNSRASSSTVAQLRWLVARLAAFATAGNRETELGERFYSGLFWHHLSDETVAEEAANAGWFIKEMIRGEGTNPTFVIMRLSATEVAK